MKLFNQMFKRLVSFCLLLLIPYGMAAAVDENGLGKNAEISLISQAGDSMIVGHVDFTKAGEGENTSYEVRIDDSKFGNYFLNMRPFKCLQGPKYMICHLPYPYEKENKLQAGNLINLEYDLLFIHRKATDYGIDPWNGLYYKLEKTKEGIKGVLTAVDMDILAAPPDDGVTHPIQASDLHEIDADAHSYPTLLIK